MQDLNENITLELVGYAVMYRLIEDGAKWWIKSAYPTLGIAQNAKDNFERDYSMDGNVAFLFKIEKIYIMG